MAADGTRQILGSAIPRRRLKFFHLDLRLRLESILGARSRVILVDDRDPWDSHRRIALLLIVIKQGRALLFSSAVIVLPIAAVLIKEASKGALPRGTALVGHP